MIDGNRAAALRAGVVSAALAVMVLASGIAAAQSGDAVKAAIMSELGMRADGNHEAIKDGAKGSKSEAGETLILRDLYTKLDASAARTSMASTPSTISTPASPRPQPISAPPSAASSRWR